MSIKYNKCGTFQCLWQRFGGAEGVHLRKRPLACLAHCLDPETVPARLAQPLQLKSVARTSVNHHKPNKIVRACYKHAQMPLSFLMNWQPSIFFKSLDSRGKRILIDGLRSYN